MNNSGIQLVGICGLYCGTCPKYLAYQDQDLNALQKMALSDKVPVKDIRCDGCLSDHVDPSCRDCRHGFRHCAEEKEVTWCFQCREFPCQRLENFSKIHVVNGVCHHKKVIENLQYMKDHGTDEWIKQQNKEGACPNCGKLLYWYSLKCPKCGISVHKEIVIKGLKIELTHTTENLPSPLFAKEG